MAFGIPIGEVEGANPETSPLKRALYPPPIPQSYRVVLKCVSIIMIHQGGYSSRPSHRTTFTNKI